MPNTSYGFIPVILPNVHLQIENPIETKQNFQVKIMIAHGVTVGVAEGIINYSCLMFLSLNFI